MREGEQYSEIPWSRQAGARTVGNSLVCAADCAALSTPLQEQPEKPRLTVAEPMIEHKHLKSEDHIKWESQRMQDFIVTDPDTSGSTGDGGDHGDVLLPSEQMKPSHSTSTYETAGSSSYMHAPSLSQASDSPQDSPTVKKGLLPATETEAPSEPQSPISPVSVSDKSRGKRKADDSEDGSPGGTKEVKTKKTTFAPDGRRACYFDLALLEVQLIATYRSTP